MQNLTKRIGQYIYDPKNDKIGEGASSEVYKARIDGTENSYVAIKIPKKRENIEKLRLEARIMDNLCDSDVQDTLFPRIHAVCLDGEEQPYLAIEYMPKNLKEFINENKEPDQLPKHIQKENFKTKIKIAEQILEALKKAHGKGYIHRDLKPENILIDSEHKIKLTDFSLTKVVKEMTEQEIKELKNSLDITKDNRFSLIGGTLGYMSPEQRDGKPADARSDIFSFGKVLYELFAGKIPSGKYKPLQEINKYIPKWLDNLIDKCLADNPKDRFGAIQNIKDYLQEGLEGKFDKPKEESIFYRNISGKKILNGLKKFGLGSLKWSTFPVWGIPYNLGKLVIWGDEQMRCGDDIGVLASLGGVFGLAGYVGAGIAVPLVLYSSACDSQLTDELIKSDIKGKIACVDQNKIKIFNASDITKERIDTKILETDFKEIEKIRFSEEGTLYALINHEITIGKEKVIKRYVDSLYSLDPESGNVDLIVQDLYTKLNGSPEDLFLSKEGKVIIKNKDKHLYQIDPKTKEVKEVKTFEHGVDQTTIKGKYGFDRSGGSTYLQIERSSGEWGSINIPVEIGNFKKSIYREVIPNLKKE